MVKKLTRYLLIALTLSLGFGQLLRFEFFGLPVYLHDFLTLTLILLLSLRGRTSQAPSQTIPLWFKLITLGLLIGMLRALTLFPISLLLVPALYSLRLLSYLSLYLLLQNSKITIHRSYILLAGTITLTIGLIQYFFLPDMRIFQYLGWDDHLNRLTLPHFDPTYTGAMLVLGLFSFYQSAWYLPFDLLALFLTYSRSIWLSVVLTLGFTTRAKGPLAIIIPIIFIVFTFLPQPPGEGTNLLRTFSITSRWEHDISLLSKVGPYNLVTGVGYNTLPLFSYPVSAYPNHASGFNNSYLTILATSGLIGFTGWFLLIKSLHLIHPHLRPALTFILIGSLFNNLLLYPFVLIYLILISVFEN